MRERFPHADVDVLQMRDLSKAEQLEELSRTSVLVSNLGSKSFRMVLLPDGAQVRLARLQSQLCGKFEVQVARICSGSGSCLLGAGRTHALLTRRA